METIANSIEKHARAHAVYGNGLMNVYIISKLLPDAKVVKGFLNFPTKSISVRHYFAIAENGDFIDPTVFTDAVASLEKNLSIEPAYETQQIEEERDALFDQIGQEHYWLFANARCVVVFISVVKELGLQLENYTIPIPRKIGVNEKCPCGSNLKFKKCHINKIY